MTAIDPKNVFIAVVRVCIPWGTQLIDSVEADTQIKHMTSTELKKFIKSCKDEAEDFKFSNKVLMAIVHVCITKIKEEGLSTKGATSDEVLEALNSFNIKDEEFDTCKKKYTEQDMQDVCLQVFALANNNLVSIDPSDIEHIKPTVTGIGVGVINFAIIKPLEYSVVYQVNAEFEDIINYEQNLMNN